MTGGEFDKLNALPSILLSESAGKPLSEQSALLG